MQLTDDIRKKVLLFQQTEITEYHIYKRLAQKIKSPENAKILDQIAEDELRHYNGWKGYTNEEIDNELDMRRTILDYMVKKHIRSYEDVSKLVLDYFSDPEKVYRKARVG